jgi:hypothetical protein
MKNILKSSVLLLLGLCALTSCDDDNEMNPVVQKPTEFVLNTPALADATYDLANSSNIELTCSQPNYGFPARTAYSVVVALNEDMKDSVVLSSESYSTKIQMDAAELASALTTLELNQGKEETDFPMTIPVYVRVDAVAKDYLNNDVANTQISSNVVKLNSVRLRFSLPPVSLPDHLYIVGNFCGWNWDNALEMVQVNGNTNVFWHLVYIDGEGGIKFNTAKAWDGGQIDYTKIHTVGGDLAGQIKDGGGNDHNIVSTTPGWYLMVITTSVSGRDIVYDVQFNKPEVWLMGTATAKADWSELEEGQMFTVPTTADGSFESPALSNNTSGDGGLRVYVKIGSFEWWRTEFMVFDNVIQYRANGGDQTHVEGAKGQKILLNFANETGSIK